MMMNSYALLVGVIGFAQAAGYVALMFVLFYKAGLRSGLMAVCLLPIVALVGNMVLPGMMLSDDGAIYGLLTANALLGAVCYLGPLLVLAIVKWPALTMAARPGDLFK